MTKPEGCVLVQMPGSPLADAETVADALARCEAADLFDIDSRAVWIKDGEEIQITGVVLQDLVRKYVATKTLAVRGSKFEVIYAPVVLDVQMTRAILTGHNQHPRDGGNLKGGSLAARLPKASAAALGLDAWPQSTN